MSIVPEPVLAFSNSLVRTPPADVSDGSIEGGGLPVLLKGWRIVLRWRWIIGSIVLSTLLLGALVTFLMTPQYRATAMIAISRQQDKIVQGQDLTPENDMADQEFYQTQYKLLIARSLAERVASDLKLGQDTSFFVKMHAKIPGSGFFWTSASEPNSVAATEERKRETVDLLLKRIKIDPVRGSRLVEVGFVSPDPKLSMAVANSWIGLFIESNLARRFDATSYARSFLGQRLEQMRQRLEASERQLVQYAAQQRIINLPAGSGAANQADRPIVADNLAALNALLSEAVVDRVKAQSEASATSSSRQGTTSGALSNATIGALRQKRTEVAGDLAETLVQFEPGYPQARALREQLAELDRGISREEGRVRQAAQSTYQETSERENALRTKVETLKNDMLDLRTRSIQYNIYQRDVDTSRALYEALLQRYKEIGVAGGVGTNNVAIVDRAQLPVDPSSPRLALNFAAALVLGLLLAGGAVFALEQLDEAIQDPAELKRLIAMPTLGIVPNTGGDNPLALLRDRRSGLSEAYLSIQTSLQFTSDHGVPLTIAITSTRSSEGKSTFSYALALVLARTGRRVILVDCDMRRPSVHSMVGIENRRGVSNFLSGDDDLAGMIAQDGEGNVAILPAGGSPPNAAELLTGSRLQPLLDRLAKLYDHVIIDCPPVLGLADAPLIASCSEGVIYLVKAGGARVCQVRDALERLRASNAHVIGTVLTIYDTQRSDYEYGYGYDPAVASTPQQA